MRFEWIPCQKIGDIEFGKQIGDYVKKYNLYPLKDEYNENVGWDVYSMESTDIRIFSDNGNIVSVACYEECYYKNKNLIGLSIEEVIKITGSTPEENVDTIYIENEPQKVYEFSEIEGQFWVKDGKVVTIFCGQKSDE